MANYEGTITYGGNTLSNANINSIIFWANKYHLLPTGMICQMYLESNWGNAGAGSNPTLNNWGGITYSSPTQFPSDISYSQGTPRPPSEGGYYVQFATLDDYFHCHAWLIGLEIYGGAGIYNCSDQTTVQMYSRGLFIYGGALYNYAASWEGYESNMVAIETGIISSNPTFNSINSFAGSIGAGVSIFLTPPIANISTSDITDLYGYRTDPISGGTDWHSAIDLGRPLGEPIYASLDGTVTQFVYPLPDTSYGGSGGGNWIEITHSNNIKTRYLHLTSILVSPSSTVTKGQQIGTMGSTGYSTGSHLHYELWDTTKPLDPDGKNTIDPYPYLFNNIPIIIGVRPGQIKRKGKWWLYMKRRY